MDFERSNGVRVRCCINSESYAIINCIDNFHKKNKLQRRYCPKKGKTALRVQIEKGKMGSQSN